MWGHVVYVGSCEQSCDGHMTLDHTSCQNIVMGIQLKKKISMKQVRGYPAEKKNSMKQVREV